MSDQFVGELRMMAFSYPPKGWAMCNGQSLPINQNQALFSLLGTYFGGNGTTTFNLPNFQGRTPLSFGNGYNFGQNGGEQNHTLQVSEMPSHSHAVNASNNPTTVQTPAGNVLGTTASAPLYGPANALANMAAGTIASNGGGQPHNNMQPYSVVNFCVSLTGIYPTRN